MKHLLLSAAVSLALLPLPAAAENNDETNAFVQANVLATLYHELGHALIDIEGVPIFGQEEDAADVLSALLINDFYEEEDAVSLAYDTAFAFMGEAERASEEGYEPAFWDVHGADEQRYYNLVCLFYGGNPDERADMADELGLPEERADGCEDEFALANDSWGAVLDTMNENAPGSSIVIGDIEVEDATAELLRQEVALLNEDFVLSDTLVVHYVSCGEANAFYDPSDRSLTMCTEYIEDLATLFE